MSASWDTPALDFARWEEECQHPPGVFSAILAAGAVEVAALVALVALLLVCAW